MTDPVPCRCLVARPLPHGGHCCIRDLPATHDGRHDRLPCHDRAWRATYDLPEPTERPTP